jgi:hypothetical protein
MSLGGIVCRGKDWYRGGGGSGTLEDSAVCNCVLSEE